MYGTILVDLEEGCVVDLLADRTTATVAAWLKEHPEIEVVSRDRFANYAEAATQGAPDAVQVADRFHLLKNLSDALRRMLDCHATTLRKAAELAADQPIDEPPPRADSVQTAAAESPSALITEPSQRPDVPENTPETRAASRFKEIKALKQQGLSNRAIARKTGLDRRTVRRYVVHDQAPVRSPRPQSTSTLMPFMDYLRRRRDEGCDKLSQLHQEVAALGFKGSYSAVRRAMHRISPPEHDQRRSHTAHAQVQPLSSRQAAWLLVQPTDKLKPEEQKLLKALCTSSLPIATAHQLAQDFCRIVRQRRADQLDTWLASAHQSGIPELRRFAEGIVRDYAAVKAALTLHWSNGPTEGFVNKLKLAKRQMYGRGKLDLLRQRLVHAV